MISSLKKHFLLYIFLAFVIFFIIHFLNIGLHIMDIGEHSSSYELFRKGIPKRNLPLEELFKLGRNSRPNYDRHSYPFYYTHTVKFSGLWLNYAKLYLGYEDLFFRAYFFKYKFLNFFQSNYFLPFSHQLRDSDNLNFFHYISKKHRRYISQYIYYTNMDLLIPYEFKLSFSKKLDGLDGLFSSKKDNSVLYMQFLKENNYYLRGPFGENLYFHFIIERLQDYTYYSYVHYFFFDKVINFFFLFLYFSFYFIFFFIFYFLIIYVFLINFLYSRFVTVFNFLFDPFLSEDDDTLTGVYEVWMFNGTMSRYVYFYEILKLDSLFFEFFSRYTKSHFLWVNKGFSDISYSFSSYDPNFSIKTLFATRIDMVFWAFEDNGSLYEWTFFPYDFLTFSFPEAPYYFKNFSKLQIEVIDPAYDAIDFGSYDYFSILEHKDLRHPLSFGFDFEDRGIFEISNEKFLLSKFLSKKFTNEYFLSASGRYFNLYKNYLRAVNSLEKAVDYAGDLNTVDELSFRAIDSSVKHLEIGYEVFEKSLSVFTFYSGEMQEEYEGFIDTPDMKYKISPIIWKDFSLINFYSLVIETAVTHYFVRSSMFWEEYGLSPESESFEEDMYVFMQEKKLHHLIEKFEKSFSFMDGFSSGRGSLQVYPIEAFVPAFKSQAASDLYLKYPVYESFVGYWLLDLEFYVKYKLFLREVTASELRFFQLSNFSLGNVLFSLASNTTNFVGYNGYPLGMGYQTFYGSEDLYKNSNSIYNEEVFESVEEQDLDFREDQDLVEDYIEVFFFACFVPAFLFVGYVLPFFF